MESTIKFYIERIKILEKRILDKDTQIQSLEQVIQNMHRMYGVKRDDKYMTREDQFLKENN